MRPLLSETHLSTLCLTIATFFMLDCLSVLFNVSRRFKTALPVLCQGHLIVPTQRPSSSPFTGFRFAFALTTKSALLPIVLSPLDSPRTLHLCWLIVTTRKPFDLLPFNPWLSLLSRKRLSVTAPSPMPLPTSGIIFQTPYALPQHTCRQLKTYFFRKAFPT